MVKEEPGLTSILPSTLSIYTIHVYNDTARTKPQWVAGAPGNRHGHEAAIEGWSRQL